MIPLATHYKFQKNINRKNLLYNLKLMIGDKIKFYDYDKYLSNDVYTILSSVSYEFDKIHNNYKKTIHRAIDSKSIKKNSFLNIGDWVDHCFLSKNWVLKPVCFTGVIENNNKIYTRFEYRSGTKFYFDINSSGPQTKIFVKKGDNSEHILLEEQLLYYYKSHKIDEGDL